IPYISTAYLNSGHEATNPGLDPSSPIMSDTITLDRTSPVETSENEGDGKEDSNWVYGST
ncbi:10186_t:CDS:2, partial [Acaulospora colombiana]